MNYENTNTGTIDTTPRKKILWASVAVCSPKNAITELQDNIIDFVAERLKQDNLNKTTITSSFNLSHEEVNIKWNLGVPLGRRLALLTPGLHVSDDNESVGTWSLGGKIALHALGDNITIRTCTPEDKNITVYKYPTGWLRNSNGDYNEEDDTNWNVLKDIESINDDNDFTEIIIKNPTKDVKKQFNKTMQETYIGHMNRVLEYVGEAYGLTFEEFGEKITFDMNINGKRVQPITYSSRNNIANNLVRVPGFEPTIHTYSMNGLKIKILVGCTAKVESAQVGMYFYGNHNRLFARRERHSEYLSDMGDITHPNKKHWQMHIFFSGDTELIPWSSPLKDSINYDHITMQMLKPILNKLPLPYIELVSRTGADTRNVFSEKYFNMSDSDKKLELLENQSNDDNLWNGLPNIVKTGREYRDDIIENYDHGDLITSQKEKITQKAPKWRKASATAFFRSSQITQTNNQSLDGKIKALWKFNTFINPTEINPLETKHKKYVIDSMQTSIKDDKSENDSYKMGNGSTSTEYGNFTLTKDKNYFDNEPIDLKINENDTELISARIQKGAVMRLKIAAHSTKPTDIMNYLVDLFYLTQNLLDSPNIPENIRSKNGIEDKMEALIDHFGGKVEE